MGEEIRLTASDGGSFAAYLALPARLPAPALVVLPEIFNANPHIRSVADRLAARGFQVVAPDIFWRSHPGVDLGYDAAGIEIGKACKIAFINNRGCKTRFGENHDAGRGLNKMRACARTDDQKERIRHFPVQPDNTGQAAKYFALTALLSDLECLAACLSKRSRRAISQS